jgi:flagellar protein FlaI
MVPRPDPDEDGREEAAAILDDAEDVFETYRGSIPDSVADALLAVDPARRVEAAPDEEREALAAVAADAEANAAAAAGTTAAETTEPADATGALGPSAEDADGEIDFDRPFDDGIDVVGPVPAADAETGHLEGDGRPGEDAPAGAIDREWNGDGHADGDGEPGTEPVEKRDPDGGDDEDASDADPVDDGWGFEAVEPTEEEG